MMQEKKKHILSFAMLCLTALVWGVGFVLSKRLLANGFEAIPFSQNAIRFGLAAVVLMAIFGRKIKWNKNLVLWGGLDGLFLFLAFGLQIFGLKYTTTSSCGFFTAAYTLFVPLASLLILKRKPSLSSLLGVALALAGLAVLSTPTAEQFDGRQFLGNMLTLGGSLFFALQIVLTEKAMRDDKIEAMDFNVVQISFGAMFFVIAAAIFESGNYASVQLNIVPCVWQMAIVSLLGTAFAYFAQTYGQKNLSATESSVVLACESPIGAIASVIVGDEAATLQMILGGLLILSALAVIEILPTIRKKHNESKKAPDDEEETSCDKTDAD